MVNLSQSYEVIAAAREHSGLDFFPPTHGSKPGMNSKVRSQVSAKTEGVLETEQPIETVTEEVEEVVI